MKKLLPFFVFCAINLIGIKFVKGVSMNANCQSNGLYALNGYTSGIAEGNYVTRKYTWSIIKDGSAVFVQTTNENTFYTPINVSTYGDGNYKLQVRYKPKFGSQITEVSNSAYLSSTFNSNHQTNNSICSSKDSIGFYIQGMSEIQVDVFPTTGYGQAKSGALINSYTFNSDWDWFHASEVMSPGQFVIIELSGSNACTNSNIQTLYFYSDPGCRIGNNSDIFSIENSSTLLFPNPVETTLSIAADKTFSKIEIYSSQGALLETITNQVTEIDFSAKESGMYYVKLHHSDGTISTQKIAKK